MKKIIIYGVACAMLMQACSPVILSESTLFTSDDGKALSVAAVAGSTTPEQNGNALRQLIQAEYIPNIRNKANKSHKVIARSGATVTAVGILGAGAAGLIDKNQHQKVLSFSISSAIALVGLRQVFMGGNQDYKNFLADLERAVTNWEISIKDLAAYNAFRLNIGDTLVKYGDLYRTGEPDSSTETNTTGEQSQQQQQSPKRQQSQQKQSLEQEQSPRQEQLPQQQKKN